MGFRKKLVALGLKILGKGVVACSKIEEGIKRELHHYKEGFIFELAVFKTDTRVALMKKGDKLEYLGSRYEGEPDLSVIFKSYDDALLLILGQIGLHDGYSQRRFIIKGDIHMGMPLVRILYYVEAYLFPNFISKKILKEMPDLSSKRRQAYFTLIFK